MLFPCRGDLPQRRAVAGDVTPVGVDDAHPARDDVAHALAGPAYRLVRDRQLVPLAAPVADRDRSKDSVEPVQVSDVQARSVHRCRRAGVGGAPPTAADDTTTRDRPCPRVVHERVSTVGRHRHRWVTPSSSSSSQTRPGRPGQQTWVPPAAVTAQVKVQPLQLEHRRVHR